MLALGDKTFMVDVCICSRSFSKSSVLVGEAITSFGAVKVNTEGLTLSGEQLIEFCYGYSALIVGLEKFDREILATLAAGGLRAIAKYGVGLDNIDLDACCDLGIELLVTRGVNNDSVAELSLFAALSLRRKLFRSVIKDVGDSWSQQIRLQVFGAVVGICGAGVVGSHVARRYLALGCHVLFHDIRERQDLCDEGMRKASKAEIFQSCDVISLHLPGGASTKWYVDEREILSMQKGAVLVNLGRGDAVNISKLIELKNTAGIEVFLDVLPEEPPAIADLGALIRSGILITPHLGGSSSEAVLQMGLAAIENLKKYYDA